MRSISFLKILVPTAGPTPASERAADVVQIASKLNGELIIMHILTPGTTGDEVRRRDGNKALEIFKSYAEMKNIKVTLELQEGEIGPSIIDYAEQNSIDLIVMGASEDQIVAEWIISDLKDQTNVPVVVIPGGFSTII